MKVRYVRFRAPQELPGCTAENVVAWDPARPQQARAFDLDVDFARRIIRIAVPQQLVEQKRIGRWIQEDTKLPNFGLGRVCYVPLEDVRKFELVEDAEADQAPGKKSVAATKS